MPKSLLETLPEVFVSNAELSARVSRAVRQGKLRKIGSRLYTRNLVDPPERIVRNHLWQLVASCVPGALIADRTAIEMVPAGDGSIFVVANHKRDIDLPGIKIRPRKGEPALAEDRSFMGGLYLSSPARAYLDNLVPSRKRSGAISRTLAREELEERLETLLRRGGVEALNRIRDSALELSTTLNREAEFAELNKLIGALLGTREAELVSHGGRARQAGTPFDPDRLKLFEKLQSDLRNWPPSVRPAPRRSLEHLETLAFFEAYFSNFIEGTEFEVSEAADIVFRNRIPQGRPQDAHDVLGTWRLVVDEREMRRVPKDSQDFIEILMRRHETGMQARPDQRPGQFKSEANRAGATVFVAPELVLGTLQQGFEFYRSLEAPLSRAIMMMFLVTEVHPFADGNGRLARIMMNAELVAAGEDRIVIPTVFRNNYLAALKAMSNSGATEPLIRVLDYGQRWTAAVAWGRFDQTRLTLEDCNAFVEPSHADVAGIRLRLPQAVQ